MTTTLRAAAGAAALAVIAALAVVLPAGIAHAATTYTWNQGWYADGTPIPQADHQSWDDPENWSPQGVPVPGDAVVLANAPGQAATTLTVPAGMTLSSFTMTSSDQGNVYLEGAPLTVSGSFDWTGGRIGIPVTVAGTGRLGAGTTKHLQQGTSSPGTGMLNVTGSLLLDDIGASDDARLSMTPDYQGDADGIRVAAGATLTATGTNLVTGTGCCTDPAKVVVDGTVDVHGTTTLSAVEVSLRGTTQVAAGSTLASTVGPARLGANARYAGGGTVDFTATASIRAYPDKEAVPGGVLMEGVGQLADGTRIHLGVGAKLTGIGGFAGNGTVDVSAAANTGQDGAHLYGELTTGADTRVEFGGAVPSRLEVWSPDLPGYRGTLRIEGTGELAGGASFTTQGGTLTTVANGATLRLRPGSTWGEGDCCTQPARLSVADGGTLTVPAGAGAAARVVRVDLRTQGTLALAAGKRLVTAGYPARLGGTLKVTGKTKPGKQRTVLTGQRLVGRFDCVRPAGQTATYTSTTVRTTGVLGKTAGCTPAGAGKKLGAKKVGKHQAWKVKATKGVGKKAKKVLLAVTVTKVAKPGRIKVGGAPAFKAAKGKKTVRYVVAKRKKKFVTVHNNGKKPVRIKVAILGAA